MRWVRYLIRLFLGLAIFLFVVTMTLWLLKELGLSLNIPAPIKPALEPLNAFIGMMITGLVWLYDRFRPKPTKKTELGERSIHVEGDVNKSIYTGDHINVTNIHEAAKDPTQLRRVTGAVFAGSVGGL